jgi:hypothetical protein
MSAPVQTYVPPTLLASGASFADLQAGGLTKLIAKLKSANAAIADATTAPTFAATGGGATGGALAAGTYYGKYCWTNGYGETLPSTESAQLTVGATNIPRVTIPSKPSGATGANLYLGPLNGASGTEFLYKSNITTTTFDLALNTWEDVNQAPPTLNTTDLATAIGPKLGAGSLAAGLDREYLHTIRILSNFVAGYPVNLTDLLRRTSRASALFKALAQLVDEAGVLIAANPGTIATVLNGPNIAQTQRTFP